MSVDSGFLLDVFRNVYSARLNEVIGEADVTDEDGKIILSPDLKVRHKDSGYEYTIDKVEGDDGEVKVYLRSPESPRVEPPAEEKALLGQPPTDDLLGEQDPSAPREIGPENVDPEEDDSEEVVFVVDQKEFEDEYEVD